MVLSNLLADEGGASHPLGAALMVGVTVVLATTLGASLTGVASHTGVKEPVQAAATVEASDSADRVTVTWIANSWAEKLKVTVHANGHQSTATLASVGDVVVVDDDGLRQMGSHSVAKSHPTLSNGDVVTVTVTAVGGGQRTVVTQKTVRV